MRLTKSLVAVALMSASTSAFGTMQALEPSESLAPAAMTLEGEELRRGWRATSLIGAPVYGWSGGEIGTVTDILMTLDGRITAVTVEGGGFFGLGGAVFRLPWDRVDITPGKKGIAVPITKRTVEELGLYDGADKIVVAPGILRITDLTDAPARLLSLVQFGQVSDIVFSQQGIALAVLVRRKSETTEGGGLGEESRGPDRAFAYPFSGAAIRRQQGDTSYLLPFETMQAAAQALRIELDRFDDGLF